ncbi:hypothetical protein I317_00311 [Kwoniella heveanensis CBS 569]|nr:hypothetical protein I317_00311 [Kwoniella heveanensis CBS 569]
MWYHECPRPFTDHTYKVDHGVQCDVRIWPAEDASAPSPFVLYFHGGAFFAGKHHLPNAWVIPALRPKGFHVVSVAYRYTPHVSLLDQVQDGIDAYAWCRENLPPILGEDKVDVDRFVLIGESAGGLIVTLLGPRLSPTPRAIVNIYGPVDLLDPAMNPNTPPSATDIQPISGEFPEEDVAAGTKERDPSKALTLCPFDFDVPVETYRKLWALPSYEYTRDQRFQYDVKRYCRTHKLLWNVLLRQEECKSDDEYVERRAAQSPLRLLDEKKGYPATVVLHGEDDKVVGVKQGRDFANRLREIGVDVLELIEPREGHEFDNKYTSSEVAGWDTYIAPIAEFLVRHTA